MFGEAGSCNLVAEERDWRNDARIVSRSRWSPPSLIIRQIIEETIPSVSYTVCDTDCFDNGLLRLLVAV